MIERSSTGLVTLSVIFILVFVIAGYFITQDARDALVDDIVQTAQIQSAQQSHAEIGHGVEEANYGRSCSNNPNRKQFFNSNTERTAFVCQLPDGRYGIHILDKFGREVTAFILKKGSKDWARILSYIQRSGYFFVH